MAFNSFSEFLAMGGHGFYVWLSYGLTFVVLTGLAWHALGSHKRERLAIVAQAVRNQSGQHNAPQPNTPQHNTAIDGTNLGKGEQT